jgi:hypothetical protein
MEGLIMGDKTSANIEASRANDTVRGPGGLTALEWAMERFENSKRIAASKTDPQDQKSWAEDVWYWRRIVQSLSPTFTLSDPNWDFSNDRSTNSGGVDHDRKD